MTDELHYQLLDSVGLWESDLYMRISYKNKYAGLLVLHLLPLLNTWLIMKCWHLNGCVCYIFASLFFKSTALVKQKKKFFISLQKLFLFLRKSNFRILDIQISWYHQMPMHKTRNTFYWITWEVSTICKWNLVSLCCVTKEKNSSKSSKQTGTWKLVPGPFVFAKN